MKQFCVALLLMLLVSSVVYSSDGSTIEVKKTDWERIAMLSSKLQTETKTLQTALTSATSDLRTSQIQLESLKISYETIKQENKNKDRWSTFWTVVGCIGVGLASGTVLWNAIK